MDIDLCDMFFYISYECTLMTHMEKKEIYDINKLEYSKSISDFDFSCARELREDKYIPNVLYTKEELYKYSFGSAIYKCILEIFNDIEKVDSYYSFKTLTTKIIYFENRINETLIFWAYGYIFSIIINYFIDKRPDVCFEYLTKLLNEDHRFSFSLFNILCYNFGTNKVKSTLNIYDVKIKKTRTDYKCRARYNRFVKYLENNQLEFKINKYFDRETHLFIIEKYGWNEKNWTAYDVVSIYKCFTTFEEFTKYLKKDLSDCDLSEWIPEKEYDFSKYETNNNTILPLEYMNLSYSIEKLYDDHRFELIELWNDGNGKEVKRRERSFDKLSEFVSYLDGDLSGGDYSSCKKIASICNEEQINLTNCLLPRSVNIKNTDNMPKFDISKYANNPITNIKSNNPFTKNRELDSRILMSYFFSDGRIYYVSDIHLEHLIINNKCKTQTEILSLINKVAIRIKKATEYYGILLICGDVASEFELYKYFVNELKKALKDKIVLFVLGNHELWQFKGQTLNKIYKKYKEIMPKDFYLLTNDLFVHNYKDSMIIKQKELLSMSKDELTRIINGNKIAVFGGNGFSGLNDKYNADIGLYRDTLNRKQEKVESKKFYNLYKKISSTKFNNLIMMSHTPVEDWNNDGCYSNNITYVYGHDHQNYYFDGLDYRIFADNQIGYKAKNIKIKYFYYDLKYNALFKYSDGIYQIAKQEYIDFNMCNGKHINLAEYINNIYMLKRDGYYCFLNKTKDNRLQILNLGKASNLVNKDINYYYDNMLYQISNIKSPLSLYLKQQKQISKFIKGVGGEGSIHGCIIDIDFNNHIYLNPLDGKATCYYATDIKNKVIYNDLEVLLKENNNKLYLNYLKKKNDVNAIIKYSDDKTNRILYLNTDIYKISNIMNKMQRIENNVLTLWIDETKLLK